MKRVVENIDPSLGAQFRIHVYTEHVRVPMFLEKIISAHFSERGVHDPARTYKCANDSAANIICMYVI